MLVEKIDYGRDYGNNSLMKTISKGNLKAKMLEYFRDVERTGEPLVVTDHGRAVLEVRPIQRISTIQDVLAEYRSGSGAGCEGIPTEEILAPVPAEEWEALRDDGE
jgi:antitoxin (DNA-binding transcriptional repressor) of toxin-antitoxin stability system